tara:strand:+ start:220 stop:726 length:507 start_codon:yes stop_codon:yes gene_type:complete
MIQTVLVNITLAWIFSVVLIFTYSKRDFEEAQVRTIATSVKNLGLAAQFHDPDGSIRTQQMAELVKSLQEYNKEQADHVRRKNKRLLIYAISIGAILLIGTVAFSIHKINRSDTLFDTRAAVLGVGVGVSLLITEVMLYMILFRAYNYGTEEIVYERLSELSRAHACA